MMNEFKLIKKDTDHKNMILYGNMFLIGNGHIGYRGTLEEYRKDQLIGLNIAGFYDRYGDQWRESVNAPNPFYVDIFQHNCLVNPPLDHQIELDIAHEVFSRRTEYSDLVLSSRRTISQVVDNVLVMEYTITAKTDTHVKGRFGLDLDIYDINGPHFKHQEMNQYGNDLFFHGITNENKNLYMDARYEVKNASVMYHREEQFYYFESDLQKGESITISVFCKIYELQYDASCHMQWMKWLTEHTIDEVFTASMSAFQKKWQVADVQIEGDDFAQFSLRYSIYHLLILGNEHYSHSIPARGLSGQTYKGAIFWDSEIFILPFFIMTQPKMARKILEYRINTLEGAKKKALEYGYKGAFFSWESQDDGTEACSKYNVTDPITNSPIRTYFNEKQIHISADIVYAMHDYMTRSKDYSLLRDGAYEVMKQVFLFLVSYAIEREGQYHFLDVIGPDEYHERVDDNAFTTYMNYEAVKLYIKYYEMIQREKMFDISKDKNIYQRAKKFLHRIYLPKINEDGILEQFKGYFALEDVTVEQVKQRVKNPKEYWGSEHGVATPTRVIKQADVIALMSLQYKKFDPHIIKANYDFYNPYTEHGSSLSASMYSQCACRIGYLEEAYQMFIKSATIDLGLSPSKMFAGGIYIGGTHPASNGGSYLSIINGFGGMTVEDGIYSFHPKLPKEIQSITFCYYQQNRLYRAQLRNEKVQIEEVKCDD